MTQYQRKNIILIPSWYKTHDKPHAGSFFEEQARALQKNGSRVSIFYPQRSGFILSALRSGLSNPVKAVDDSGLPTYYLPIFNIFPNTNIKILASATYILNSRFIMWQAQRAFRKIIKLEGKPDIIHSHSAIWGGAIGTRLASKYGIRHILTEHSSLVGSYTNPIANRILQHVYDNAHAVLAVSDSLRDVMIKTYALDPHRVKTIPNVLNPVFAREFIPKDNSRPFRLLIAGNLIEGKNHISLLDAINSLSQKEYNIHLDIAGDGPLCNVLKAYVNEHILQDRIAFLGKKSRIEIADLMKASHCIISVSHLETFGVTLIESLASGRPVIATNSGGPADIVNSENGILIDGFSTDKIARAIEEMMENYERFDQVMIRNEALNKYSEDALVRSLYEVYNS